MIAYITGLDDALEIINEYKAENEEETKKKFREKVSTDTFSILYGKLKI